MKIFLVSVLAFKPSKNLKGEPIALAYHAPGLLPAVTFEQAAEIAKEFVFSFAPESEGYYGHQALIQPVTNDFQNLIEVAKAAGTLDLSTEPHQVFTFKSSVFDDDVVFEG